MSLWRGGVVQRGLQQERETGDERCVSESSANDKHLCLVSVIGMERPDKSHWKRRLARERLTGNSYQAGRLNAGAEVYIWSYIQSIC